MIPLEQINFEPTRLKRQIGIIHQWEELGSKNTLLASTGFGKTVTGILAIRRNVKTNPTYKNTIVIVPTVYLEEQWNQKIAEHGLEDHVRVIIINSLLIETTHQKLSATLLILDEIHKYVATEFKKVYDCVIYNKILGLTATLDFEDDRFRIIQDRCPVFETVTIQECLTNKWVNNFTIYTLPVELTKKEKEVYRKFTSSFNNSMAFFGYNFDMMMKCLNHNLAKAYATSINKDPKVVFITALNGTKAVKERKNVLYNAENKFEIIKELDKKFLDSKTIFFSQTSESADRIAQDTFSCKSYHTNISTIILDKKTHLKVGESVKVNKKTMYYVHGIPQSKIDSKLYYKVSGDKQRESVMTEFMSGKILKLSTAMMLDVGADIPDIENTIIEAGTSKALQDVQRRGRGIRYVENKIARNIQLYVQDEANDFKSQEKKWLTQRLENIPNVVDVTSVSEII